MGSSLAFRRLQLAKQAVAKSWRGFSAQYTPIDQTDPYSFEFTGTEHYLANHDLILDDGSMTVDGLSPAPGGDLRGKMTYVPSGRKIEGWAQPADRNNSFTAIYFDPAILSEETERMFSTGDFVPSVYFRDDNIRNTLERLEIALRSDNDNHVFVETLGLLGALEVARLQAEFAAAPDYRTSKLSARQERRVRDFIDARYADDIGFSGRNRGAQPVSLRTSVQGHLRHHAAPVSDGQTDRGCARHAEPRRTVDGRNRAEIRLSVRHQFLAGLSHPDRRVPFRLPQDSHGLTCSRHVLTKPRNRA